MLHYKKLWCFQYWRMYLNTQTLPFHKKRCIDQTYYVNLCDIDDAHTGLKDTLDSGTLSIRRTYKSLSRTAVDMTYEQTINADVALRQTCIYAFDTLDLSRRRWMVTRSARISIFECLIAKAGLTTTEDITTDLKPYRIKGDTNDLNSVVDDIAAGMNPVNVAGEKNRCCLTSRKSITYDIK